MRGGPPSLSSAPKIRPRGAYARPHKSGPSHKLRYGSIKVKIMYEICLLIILSAGSGRLPLSRSRALGAQRSSSLPLFPPPVAVMPPSLIKPVPVCPVLGDARNNLAATVMRREETVILSVCLNLVLLQPPRVSLSESDASFLPVDVINQTRYRTIGNTTKSTRPTRSHRFGY